MTENKEENKEEVLTNQTFHNWKNHECTKALLKTIDDCLEKINKLVLEELEGKNKINVHQLYFCRGGKYIAEQIKEKALDIKELQHFLGGEDE